MLHYFPLEHIPNRYTTHLDRDVVKYLDENEIDYIYYEPKTPTGEEKVSGGCFLNAVSTVYRQMHQMQQFLQNFHDGKVNEENLIFLILENLFMNLKRVLGKYVEPLFIFQRDMNIPLIRLKRLVLPCNIDFG